MAKIIEAEVRIKEVCAYFYDGDKNDLQEFLDHINSKLSCTKLILNREDNEISIYSSIKKKNFETIPFMKRQYITAFSTNHSIDSIGINTISEKDFDKLYSKKQIIDISTTTD